MAFLKHAIQFKLSILLTITKFFKSHLQRKAPIIVVWHFAVKYVVLKKKIYALSVDYFINKTWAHLAMLQYWCYHGPDVAVEVSPNSNVPYAKRIGNPLILMRSCSWKSGDSLLLCILRMVSAFCVFMSRRIFVSSRRKRVPFYLYNEYKSLLKWVKETNGKQWSKEESWGNEQNNGTRQETCKK